jgi:hypothetical protein
MQKHNRRALCPRKDEVSELATVKDEAPPELPADVVDALRSARNQNWCMARRITDEIYAYESNREGMALDCSFQADYFQYLLEQYNYAIGDPPFYW